MEKMKTQTDAVDLDDDGWTGLKKLSALSDI